MAAFVICGDYCFCGTDRRIETVEKGFLPVENGICRGVFRQLPERFACLPRLDFAGRLIIPGMTDLHLHAPQYSFRGLGMDLELLDWLSTYTFPEEAKYRDLHYAEQAYDVFCRDLLRSATTRASIFATVHAKSTLLLMKKLEETGLITCVGKVNMDRNCPDYIREAGPEVSCAETEHWIQESLPAFQRTRPILTPRFIPTCSDQLLAGLRQLQERYDLPTQSHLSENYSEIQWVRELQPRARSYADAYHLFGLFGEDHRCIMAHCVHCTDDELELIRDNGVFIAHSPESNMNLASGVAPVSRYLELGLRVGLATDVAGGSHVSMLRAVTHAIQASKLRWRLLDQSVKPLTLDQAFYMATEGGGGFFGRVGSFREGFEFDALVLEDKSLPSPRPLPTRDRLERLIYLGDERNIISKFVAGRRLF